MIALIAVHFGLALLASPITRLLGQRVFWLFAVVPAVAFGWLASLAPAILAGGSYTHLVPWVDLINLRLDVRIELLQWVLALIVSGVGALVLFYCRWYFAGDRPQARVAGLMLAFAGAMLGLVTADNLLGLYIYWEVTTVLSYLLVGHNPLRAANRGAAMTALLVTTFGGLAMLGGFILLAQQTGTLSLHAIMTTYPQGAAANVATILIMLGALTKSAQVPFHFWLPGAMAAPTPVSAYLHSAAMVKAGVYLLAVLAPVLVMMPVWRPILMFGGALTMVIGGFRALVQHDIKLLLAFGTVSQLGFLVVLFGSGTQAGVFAGLAMLVAHATFKSALFLTVGIVDHSAGTRDLRELSGVGRQMPIVATAATLAGMSMAGLPPTLGFIGKEAAFESATYWWGPNAGGTGLLPGPVALLVGMLVLGTIFTVAYTLRFLWGAFARKRTVAKQSIVHAVGIGFGLAPVLLGALSLAGGFTGSGLTPALTLYAETVPIGEPSHGLALWHGWSAPLAMSALCWLLGALLFLGSRRLIALHDTMPEITSAQEVYYRILRGLDRLAVEVTARAQPGSLPLYLASIFVVLMLAAGLPSFLQTGLGASIRLWDHPAQAVIGVFIMAAAYLAATARGRLKAVVLVGITGYGLAMLFLLHGAPDIALTQLLSETVSLVVFVLVLRKLPKYFTDRPLASTRWWRVVMAVGVATSVVLAMLVSSTARIAPPVSEEFNPRAYEFGYGRNIVNVTLVDIRAWDTLGEIAVLLVAATGVASLIFIRARYTRYTPAEMTATWHNQQEGQPRHSWLRAGAGLPPMRRSLVMEVVTRLLFPIMIIISVYVLMAGHNYPGGGFAGGLVAGLALVLRYLAGGRHELDEAAPVDAGLVLGGGMVLSVASAVAPVFFGGTILQSYVFDIHIPYLSELVIAGQTYPGLGEIHLVTSVFFDIGVYLLVIGLMLDIARSLGSGIDVQAEQDRAPMPELGGGVRGGISAVRLPGRDSMRPEESEI